LDFFNLKDPSKLNKQESKGSFGPIIWKIQTKLFISCLLTGKQIYWKALFFFLILGIIKEIGKFYRK